VDLVNYFMDEFSNRYGKPRRPLSPEQVQALTEYPWPGNVRELRNVVEQYLLLGDECLPSMGSGLLVESLSPKQPPVSTHDVLDPPRSLFDAVKQKGKQIERAAIIDAINRSGGNKTKAAKLLGMSYRTLHNKIKRHNIVTEVSAR
jgi:two-component system response regulator AtoC